MLHRWKIEGREYERHEQRRGRRHAFESLEPVTTALVVVDMVEFFVAENPYCGGVVPTINALADTVRSAGGTVAWVVPGFEEATPRRVEFYDLAISAVVERRCDLEGARLPAANTGSHLRLNPSAVTPCGS